MSKPTLLLGGADHSEKHLGMFVTGGQMCPRRSPQRAWLEHLGAPGQGAVVEWGWFFMSYWCSVGGLGRSLPHSGNHVAGLFTRGTRQCRRKTRRFDLAAPDCSSNHHLAARLPARHQQAAGSSSRDQQRQGRLANTWIRGEKREKRRNNDERTSDWRQHLWKCRSCSTATCCHFYSLQKKRLLLLTCQSKPLDYLCTSLFEKIGSDTPEMRQSKTLLYMF